MVSRKRRRKVTESDTWKDTNMENQAGSHMPPFPFQDSSAWQAECRLPVSWIPVPIPTVVVVVVVDNGGLFKIIRLEFSPPFRYEEEEEAEGTDTQ